LTTNVSKPIEFTERNEIARQEDSRTRHPISIVKSNHWCSMMELTKFKKITKSKKSVCKMAVPEANEKQGMR
jgi:hypothetical protein